METSLLVFIYAAIINVLALFAMGGDKFSAGRARDFQKRMPEGILFFLAVMGGSLGVLAGMFLFRHKTRKWYFLVGLPALLLQQGLLLVYIFNISFVTL
jgi:uncharacterized membrane protein YsdA (DUF1294 family)